MKLQFLGTGSIPTPQRTPHSMLLEFEDDVVMIDAGEGAQLKLNDLLFDINRLSRVFLTHEHVDHVLGVIGVIMMSFKSNHKIEICGPKTTLEITKKLVGLVADIAKDFVVYKELKAGDTINESHYKCTCHKSYHTEDSLAYRFVAEKSILFTGDLTFHEECHCEDFQKDVGEVDVVVLDGVHIRDHHIKSMIEALSTEKSFLMPIRLGIENKILEEKFDYCSLVIPNDLEVYTIGE